MSVFFLATGIIVLSVYVFAWSLCRAAGRDE